ncbi:amidase [Corynebacterium lowii]|uniref:amidase n=1 Tax=Corynebacterium lowii TaxID=1544413 RepID=A0A0Q1DTP9_9CORY|nr:amidase [Corynebacterium lowii]KQB83444.1 Enantioselective amidase [Corynebacterium lowii]MDP9852489.1 amidase [Corynebacterium lowii]
MPYAACGGSAYRRPQGLGSAASASPVEAVERFARSISELSPAEHGFSHLDIPRALARALARAQAIERRSCLRSRPLHGMVIPVKDLYDVAGMPTTFGSRARTRTATRTEPFVRSLLERGAVVPGKTATSELGMTAYLEPVGLPAVENPRLPGCTPGGSSGGAAVAVARGLVNAAHASDGGGSIRIPSAACAVVGYKPPHESHGGVLSTQGFITRSVELSAYLHGVELPTDLPRLRVGLLTEPLFASVDVAPRWREAAEHAARLLSRAGHRVVPVSPPPIAGEVFAAFRTIFTAGAAAVPAVRDDERGVDKPSPMVTHLRSVGSHVSPEDLHHAHEVQATMPALAEVDVVLNPTLAWDPPPIGHFSSLPPEEDFWEQTRWTPWASWFNMNGQAAVSVPCGGAGASVHLGAITVPPSILLALAREVSDEVTPAH